jgi:hypothetical protein
MNIPMALIMTIALLKGGESPYCNQTRQLLIVVRNISALNSPTLAALQILHMVGLCTEKRKD